MRLFLVFALALAPAYPAGAQGRAYSSHVPVEAAALPALPAALPGFDAPGALDLHLDLIQSFRLERGLAPLDAAQAAALRRDPAALETAQLEASAAFLENVNPRYSTDPLPNQLESPAEQRLRVLVQFARQLHGTHQTANDDAPLPPARRALVAMAAELELSARGRDELQALARDGDTEGLLETARALKPRTETGKMRLRRFVEHAERVPPAPEPRNLRARTRIAQRRAKDGDYAGAYALLEDVLTDIAKAPLHAPTRRALSLDIALKQGAIKERGANRLYDRGEPLNSAKLHAKVEAIRAEHPEDVVGSPVPDGPVRVQECGDCKVQQSYNMPAMERVAEQIPYPSFLRAVETLTRNDFRREGMRDTDSARLFEQFGLTFTSLKQPKTEAQLLAHLGEHGALTASMTARRERGMKINDNNHAIVVQGAFREDGAWRFVVVDSNFKRPRVYSWDELALLNVASLHSLHAPEGLSPAALRANIKRFYETYGVLRAARETLWSAFKAWLGGKAAEVLERDPNAVPLTRVSGSLRRKALAVRRDRGRLPPEALLTGPDGKRYLNRHVIERLTR